MDLKELIRRHLSDQDVWDAAILEAREEHLADGGRLVAVEPTEPGRVTVRDAVTGQALAHGPIAEATAGWPRHWTDVDALASHVCVHNTVYNAGDCPAGLVEAIRTWVDTNATEARAYVAPGSN